MFICFKRVVCAYEPILIKFQVVHLVSPAFFCSGFLLFFEWLILACKYVMSLLLKCFRLAFVLRYSYLAQFAFARDAAQIFFLEEVQTRAANGTHKVNS